MPVDLDSLNAEQRKAVLTTEGPVLVLAGPGSGKTRVTTTRVAHLVDMGLDPAGIVAITFTNKAAAEMRHRIGALLPNVPVTDMWVQTFHSMCLRILKTSEHLLDVGRFTIFDESAVKSLFRDMLKDMDLHNHHLAGSFRREVSNAKNSLVGADDYASMADTEDEEAIALVYLAYQDRLRAQHGFDFDDLILETVNLMEEHPSVQTHYQSLFHHLHVDEYQDTNYAQYKLINMLSGPNIMVVGDDDQSIYGFRGSDSRHIRSFLTDYPNAVVIPLGQNYRSTSRIVAVSSAMIAKNRGRSDKRLRTGNQMGTPVRVHGVRDDRAEAQFVVDATL
jgi:DNA helicase-2/ATP-dependent DNA helicase PcrA